MNLVHFLFLLCILLVTACNSGQVNLFRQEGAVATVEEPHLFEQNHPAELELQAQAALTDFFQSLNQGMYERAVELFGGSYDELFYFNPKMDMDSHDDLLKAGCELNGFICLSTLSSVLVLVEDQQNFYFDVEFANPDGSLFVLGPCCGATEEIMSPMSVFRIHVRCDDAGFCQVLDLPPYVP